MKITFTDKKVDMPGNVHWYAEKKVSKLDRYFRTEAEANVAFSVEKMRNKVELTVRADNTYFRATESTSDMLASIDAAVSSIERQIRKYKTKLDRRLRQDAFSRTPAPEEVSSFVPEEPEEDTFTIVRSKSFPMKPMTREEAILQMNLLGHSFFAFRDEDNNAAFAVVYKRNDGDYGIIEDQA
jgi:putative sigma-54 modulation protein